MTTILVAADAKWVRDQVRAAFMGRGQNVVEVTRGQDVREPGRRPGAGPPPEIDRLQRILGIDHSPHTPPGVQQRAGFILLP